MTETRKNMIRDESKDANAATPPLHCHAFGTLSYTLG